MYESGVGYLGGPVKMSAISGIDMALWDLAGKASGLPVHKMLGGTFNDRIKIYTAVQGQTPQSIEPGDTLTINRSRGSRFATPPEAYRDSARILVQEWGYRALKIHFGVGDGLEVTSQIDGVVERFAAVKEGAGPGVDVAIDLHNPNPAIGRQLIEALAPHRPLFIEEPMPIERIDVLTQTAAGTSATIAAGERWMGKWAFFDVLTKGVVSVVQPDMCHAGGITECKKIATMAEAAYAKLAIHCPLSSLAFAASVQVDACSPNFLIQEHSGVNDSRVDGKTLIGRGYFKDPFELGEDGCVAVPEGPGLGVEIDNAGFERLMAKPWSGSIFG
jgi:galactonate dehydratase